LPKFVKTYSFIIVLAVALSGLTFYHFYGDDLNGDSYTVTQSFIALTQDSFVSVTSQSYETAWNQEWGTVSFGSSIIVVGQFYYEYYIGEDYYDIYRGFLPFDTSMIPDNAQILAAEISLCVDMLPQLASSEFSVVIQNGNPHVPPLPADYNRLLYGGNGGARTPFGTAVEGNYWNITLNAQGLSWLKKDAISHFVLRSDKDISGTTPPFQLGEQIYFRSADYGHELGEDEPSPPILYVTYKVPM